MLTLDLTALVAATKPEPQPILPEAAMARLTEAADRFTLACPFEPGQFVTPRADGPFDNAGQPHLVIDVDPHDGRQACAHHCWSHGETFDLRLIHIDGDGDILPMRGPHWAFEPYVAANKIETPQSLDEPAVAFQTVRLDVSNLSALIDSEIEQIKGMLERADPIEIAVRAVERAMATGFGLRNIVSTIQARRDGQVPKELNIRDAYVQRACLLGRGLDGHGSDGGAAMLAALLGDLVALTEGFVDAGDWQGLRERIDRALADHQRAAELRLVPAP